MKIRVWPHIIFAFLALDVTVVVITVIAASADPTFAVEPDYYTKAKAWDQHAQERDASSRLGWHVAVVPVPRGACQALRIHAQDRAGDAIEQASVVAEAFHGLAAGQRHELAFEPIAPGQYEAVLPNDRPGPWQLRLRIERDRDVFVEEREVYVQRALRSAHEKSGEH